VAPCARNVETVVSEEHTTSILRAEMSYMGFRNGKKSKGRWQNDYPLCRKHNRTACLYVVSVITDSCVCVCVCVVCVCVWCGVCGVCVVYVWCVCGVCVCVCVRVYVWCVRVYVCGVCVVYVCVCICGVCVRVVCVWTVAGYFKLTCVYRGTYYL
jgi:hypothetical protein